MRWGLAMYPSWPDINMEFLKLTATPLTQNHPLYSLLGLQVCHHTLLTQKSTKQKSLL